MTKIPRKQSNLTYPDRFAANLYSSIAVLRNDKEIRGFLQELLTHTELIMLSNRIQIVRLLLEGKSYQAIRTQTGAQNSTIAKINNLLHTSHGHRLADIVQRTAAVRPKTVPTASDVKMTGDGTAKPPILTFGTQE